MSSSSDRRPERAEALSDGAWEQWKATIREEYLVNDREVADIVAILAKRGLPVKYGWICPSIS